MKIRNNIAAVIITAFILQLPCAGILAQDLNKGVPVDKCYLGINVSWSKRQYAEGSSDYVYNFRFFNTYTKAVKFKYWFKVGDKTFDGTTPMIKATTGTFTDGDRTFTSTEVPSVYIDEVCFEGMNCGGEDNCYAKCSTEQEPDKPVIPCGLNSTQPENKAKTLEKTEQAAQNPSGLYKITKPNISQNCSFENAVAIDPRCPEMKYCIQNNGPYKEGSDLIVYVVKVYNTSGNDFMWIDLALTTAKGANSEVELKKLENITPSIAGSPPGYGTATYVYRSYEHPEILFFKNVVIKDLWGKIKVQF